MRELSGTELEMRCSEMSGWEMHGQFLPLANGETLTELKGEIHKLCSQEHLATLCVGDKPGENQGVSRESMVHWLNHGIPDGRHETIADAAWKAFCEKAQEDYRTDEGKSTTLEISIAKGVEDPTAHELGVNPIVVLVGQKRRKLDDPLGVKAIRTPYLAYDRICMCLMSLMFTPPGYQAIDRKPVRDPILTAAYNALDHAGKIELLGIAGVLIRSHARDDWPFDKDALTSLIDKVVEGDGKLSLNPDHNNEAERAIIKAHL